MKRGRAGHMEATERHGREDLPGNESKFSLHEFVKLIIILATESLSEATFDENFV